MEVGDKFNRLTLIEKYKGKKYLFKCECGNEKMINYNNVRIGAVKSCGCLFLEGNNRKHGDRYKRLYGIWKGMRERCNTPSCSNYKNYGARGIQVCEEWNNYSTFKEWALKNGYDDSLTIDRINVDGNYEPNNCRWSTCKEQSNNKTNNRRIMYNGETLTLSQWADKTKIDIKVLWSRLDNGWDIEKTLTTPVNSFK